MIDDVTPVVGCRHQRKVARLGPPQTVHDRTCAHMLSLFELGKWRKPLPEISVELTPEELKAVARNKAQVISGLEAADVNASQRAHDKLQQAAEERLR